MQSTDFPFIVSNGPKVPRDPAVRTLIRKQAMKDVGIARKRKGTHGRSSLPRDSAEDRGTASTQGLSCEDWIDHTTIELPILTNSSSSGTESSEESTPEPHQLVRRKAPHTFHDRVPHSSSSNTQAVKYRGLGRASRLSGVDLAWPATYSIYSPMQARGYEAMRMEFDVDLTDLSVLAGFNIGHGAATAVATDPLRLTTLMQCRQWSFLDWVPSLYGNSHVVTTATDCVAAKVRSILSPSERRDGLMKVLSLYSKALRALTKAVSDSDACLSPEVLCATQIMAIYELLDTTKEQAWARHIAGSARLVELRSSVGFETDFEKALFIAHCGPLISEALVEDKHIYLEEKRWQQLYLSMAKEGPHLTDRSYLVLSIRALMFPLPGLWHDVSHMLTDDGFEEKDLAPFLKQTQESQQGLLKWLDEYKDHCVRTSMQPQPQAELDKRREVFGSCLECLIIVKRMLAALSESERLSLETEVQVLAHLVLKLQQEPSSPYSWVFTSHEIGVANSVIVTKEEWENNTFCSPYSREAARKARYERWCNTLRMK